MSRPTMGRRGFLKVAGAAVSLGGLAGCQTSPGHREPVAEGLATTPPMGWNSFDSYGVYLYEEAALANLDAMAEKLQPHGYQYFVVDHGWYGEYKLFPGTRFSQEKHASDIHVNEYGLTQPSACYFPNGLKPIIDRCHQKGLKFGIHMMRGIPRKAVALNTPIQGTPYRARDVADTESICSWCHYNYGVNMSKPGAQAFYNSLVNQLAGWGVDFIKADDIVPYPAEIEGVAHAIRQCGRPIVLSLSPGNVVNPNHVDAFRMANMLRVTRDIWDDQKDIDMCFEAWREWQGKERPGFWIDMDMIPFGRLCLMSPPEYASTKGHGGMKDEREGLVALAGKGTTRQSFFTRPQMITFITLRALSASPLMVGGDLPTMDALSLSLLTNREMIACNQNGVMGRLVSEADHVKVWLTPQRDAEERGWVGVFNRNAEPVRFEATPAVLGLTAGGTYRALDVWTNRRLTLGASPARLEIPGHGAAFLRYERTRGI